MESKIILELKDSGANVSYEPELEQSSFASHINNALNTMPHALLQMFATIPVLRPACDQEHEAHTYVFNEGERGDTENKLYKYRKNLYDQTAAIFSELLATAFPDIEYIEGCRNYQQEFCMTHNEEETKAYLEEINKVVAYVRENFDEVLKNLIEEEVPNETEEETIKS